MVERSILQECLWFMQSDFDGVLVKGPRPIGPFLKLLLGTYKDSLYRPPSVDESPTIADQVIRLVHRLERLTTAGRPMIPGSAEAIAQLNNYCDVYIATGRIPDDLERTLQELKKGGIQVLGQHTDQASKPPYVREIFFRDQSSASRFKALVAADHLREDDGKKRVVLFADDDPTAINRIAHVNGFQPNARVWGAFIDPHKVMLRLMRRNGMELPGNVFWAPDLSHAVDHWQEGMKHIEHMDQLMRQLRREA